MLSTASTKVLVNDRPGEHIHHARELRQGDPLSPLLFVIVMEVLNALITEADRQEIFSPLLDKIKYQASIYADDLVIFLSPSVQDFTTSGVYLSSSRGHPAWPPMSTSVSSHRYAVLRNRFRLFVRSFYAGCKNSPPHTWGHFCRSLACTVLRSSASWMQWLPAYRHGRAAYSLTPARPLWSVLHCPPFRYTSICCCLSTWAIKEIDK
jgi:hypothetical protein